MSRFFSFWSKKSEKQETNRNGLTGSSDHKLPGSEPESTKLSQSSTKAKRTVAHPDGCFSLYERFNLQYVLRSIETVDHYVKVCFNWNMFKFFSLKKKKNEEGWILSIYTSAVELSSEHVPRFTLLLNERQSESDSETPVIAVHFPVC